MKSEGFGWVAMASVAGAFTFLGASLGVAGHATYAKQALDAEKRAESAKADALLTQKVMLRKFALVSLKDPDSVIYRNEKFTASGVLCGEMNAKNSMGGFTGYKRFIVAPGQYVNTEHFGLVALSLDPNADWKKVEALESAMAKISEIKGENAEAFYRHQLDGRWKSTCETSQ